MKVIDLLNKIANGEEVPKIIKWGTHEFEWFVYEYRTKDEFQEPTLLSYLSIAPQMLNDEVEIIEEPFTEEIEELVIDYAPDIEEKIFYDKKDKPNHCIVGDAGTELLINKINEIIRKLKEAKDEK